VNFHVPIKYVIKYCIKYYIFMLVFCYSGVVFFSCFFFHFFRLKVQVFRLNLVLKIRFLMMFICLCGVFNMLCLYGNV